MYEGHHLNFGFRMLPLQVYVGMNYAAVNPSLGRVVTKKMFSGQHGQQKYFTKLNCSLGVWYVST